MKRKCGIMFKSIGFEHRDVRVKKSENENCIEMGG